MNVTISANISICLMEKIRKRALRSSLSDIIDASLRLFLDLDDADKLSPDGISMRVYEVAISYAKDRAAWGKPFTQNSWGIFKRKLIGITANENDQIEIIENANYGNFLNIVPVKKMASKTDTYRLGRECE